MNEYTASSGKSVFARPYRGSAHEIEFGWASNTEGDTFVCTTSQFDALREFFRAEEDKRLERWRWPERPDFVVYPNNDGWVHVLREDSPLPVSFTRALTEDRPSGFRDAARAYFHAHPEPKPWHNAKPGEVWLLTCDNDILGGAYVAGVHTFIDAGRGLWINSPRIVSGRRIWPEEALHE